MLHQRIQHGLLGEITLNKVHIRETIHWQQVEGKNAPLIPQQAGDILCPTSRSRAKINHHLPRTQHPVTLLNFNQLVHRTRAPTLALGALHIGIGKVFM